MEYNMICDHCCHVWRKRKLHSRRCPNPKCRKIVDPRKVLYGFESMEVGEKKFLPWILEEFRLDVKAIIRRKNALNAYARRTGKKFIHSQTKGGIFVTRVY